ncbi:MAG: hypothetical protein ACTSYA_04200 [Candidatus Kariarchaeaceae archaeon]
MNHSTDSSHSLSWPLPFSFLMVGSLLYSLYNFLLFILDVSTKDIWFIPGPLARILQGIFLFLLFSFLYFLHSTRLKTNPSFSYPSSLVLFGFLLSLTVHYLGMLPPWEIYDTFRFLDKLIHFLNCFWLAWIFIWWFSLLSPELSSLPFSFRGLHSSPLFLLCLKAFSLSFILSFLWEVLEFVSLPDGIDWWNASSMSYGFKDTVFDLTFDFFGSLIGSLFALKKTYQ